MHPVILSGEFQSGILPGMIHVFNTPWLFIRYQVAMLIQYNRLKGVGIGGARGAVAPPPPFTTTGEAYPQPLYLDREANFYLTHPFRT